MQVRSAPKGAIRKTGGKQDGWVQVRKDMLQSQSVRSKIPQVSPAHANQPNAYR